MSAPNSAPYLFPVWLALACAGPPPPPIPVAVAPHCRIAAGQGSDTIPVLLGESVDPAHAPIPTNDAEALVFRQLYETLFSLDCGGEQAAPLPGLATAWQDEGTRWTFTLRPGASFQDGSPLDATTIFEAWRATDSNTVVTGVRSDGSTLTVYLSEPRDLFFFAEPTMRVLRRIPGSAWPYGTSRWRVAPDTTHQRLTLEAEGGRSLVRFEHRQVADDRDLLDAGTSLLITRSPSAIAYARGLAEWIDTALFWDRAYVLLTPNGAEPDPAALAAIRNELARDVVRGDARPSGPDRRIPRCLAADRTALTATRPRVVYPRGDQVARRLAERLVARAESHLSSLVGTPIGPSGGTVTAVGLSAAGLDSALQRRDDWAVLVPVFPTSVTSCTPLGRFGSGWGSAIPLVETRAHALVKSTVLRVSYDRHGVVIEPAPGRRR